MKLNFILIVFVIYDELNLMIFIFVFDGELSLFRVCSMNLFDDEISSF